LCYLVVLCGLLLTTITAQCIDDLYTYNLTSFCSQSSRVYANVEIINCTRVEMSYQYSTWLSFPSLISGNLLANGTARLDGFGSSFVGVCFATLNADLSLSLTCETDPGMSDSETCEFDNSADICDPLMQCCKWADTVNYCDTMMAVWGSPFVCAYNLQIVHGCAILYVVLTLIIVCTVAVTIVCVICAFKDFCGESEATTYHEFGAPGQQQTTYVVSQMPPENNCCFGCCMGWVFGILGLSCLVCVNNKESYIKGWAIPSVVWFLASCLVAFIIVPFFKGAIMSIFYQ